MTAAHLIYRLIHPQIPLDSDWMASLNLYTQIHQGSSFSLNRSHTQIHQGSSFPLNQTHTQLPQRPPALSQHQGSRPSLNVEHQPALHNVTGIHPSYGTGYQHAFVNSTLETLSQLSSPWWANEIQSDAFMCGVWVNVVKERLENWDVWVHMHYDDNDKHFLTSSEYMLYAQCYHPTTSPALATMDPIDLEMSLSRFDFLLKDWTFFHPETLPPSPVLIPQFKTPHRMAYPQPSTSTLDTKSWNPSNASRLPTPPNLDVTVSISRGETGAQSAASA
ncbi:hypothetical protein BC829DRAFT_433399 [Chytridium lagenaria]|nr:hypothetical protein BC829DRAFT_433399 [Chytridium lagenaria]